MGNKLKIYHSIEALKGVLGQKPQPFKAEMAKESEPNASAHIQSPVPTPQGRVLSIGNFDGIHLGHQELLNENLRESQRLCAFSSVLTFQPHPLEVLKPEVPYARLLSREDQIKNLQQMGLNELIIHPFSRDFSRLSKEQFLEQFVLALEVKALVLGFNFRFGFNKEGDTDFAREFLKSYNIEVRVIPPFLFFGQALSTSLIKQYLADGDVQKVCLALARPFCVHGIVTQGNKRGRSLGFPTANLISDYAHFLRAGVYRTRVKYANKVYSAITNVGFNPTFLVEKRWKTIETHIFDFDEDLYGKEISLEWLSFIRPEMKFSSAQALKQQIAEDIKRVKQIEANSDK